MGGDHHESTEAWCDGVKFTLPRTLNTVQTYLHPNFASGFALFISFSSIGLAIWGNMSIAFHIWLHFVFRIGYNVGIGYHLDQQSKHQWLTKFYEKNTKGKDDILARALRRLCVSGVEDAYDPDKYPAGYNAWLVHKQLVNVVLINDSVTYLILGYKCWGLPDHFSLWLLVQYIFGVCLGIFNWLAKKDAHRCIGEYCWYWGDFFYEKKIPLVFDGIFELVPHPMYTVGYSLYYGYSIITRSYTMFFVSLAAHMMQISFLVIVEEPHIKRTYGVETAHAEKYKALYDKCFPTRKGPMLWWNLDLKSWDVAVIVLTVVTVLLNLVADRRTCVVYSAMWRLVQWVGLGGILWMQSRSELWTRVLKSRGLSLHETMATWRQLFNAVLTTNAVAFVACALRHFPWSRLSEYVVDGWSMTLFCGGTVLCFLNLYSVRSMYNAVGDFGWFYADFFVPPEDLKLSYTGVYRYMNNPDCVTGYAALYGAAMICQSREIFFLAALAHLLNIAFLFLVEIPHTTQLHKEYRKEGPVYRTLLAAATKLLSGKAAPSAPTKLSGKAAPSDSKDASSGRRKKAE